MSRAVSEQTPQFESGESAGPGRSRLNFIPAQVFLPLAWVLGILYAVVTPPFQVPDEFQHFYRAYQVSEGRLTAYRQDGRVGGDLPTRLKTFGEQIWGKTFDPTKKIAPGRIWDSRLIPLDPQNQQFFAFGNVSWHSPTNYLPQAIGIAVAREFDAGPMGIFYAGRFANLLSWSLLIYFSLRVIPILRWTFLLLALTPMSLAQAASLSADATVNGICFLFVAVAVRCAMTDAPIRPRELAGLTVCGAALALAKTAYFPLTLLFLLIPAQRFSGGRRYGLAFCIFMMICAATAIGWSLCTFGAESYSMANVSPHQQLVYMLHHPALMLHMELGMLLAVPFLSSIIGQLGWHQIKLWLPLTATYFAIIFWSTQLGGIVTRRFTSRQRLVLALAAVGCWAMVFSLIYLTFTPVGGTSINGLQGRYMIPVTAPFFLMFYSARRRPPGAGGALITPFALLFSLYALAVLVRRFYIW